MNVDDNDDQFGLNFDKKPDARSGDPETSHEAAAQFSGKRLTKIRKDVFLWFCLVWRATDEHLEDHFARIYTAQTTVSKRRTELVEMGLLEWSGEWEINRNNCRMRIWQVSELGYKVYDSLKNEPKPQHPLSSVSLLAS